ncbi:MAG: DUF374 domain-containing protein [Leptospiraceae bacterium]|nr:DUF374 domain-containing protein [Leptospiraceae bacterium]MCB1201640.1 DUF374 domain-containing protein [Leptospiraceae bacterium]
MFKRKLIGWFIAFLVITVRATCRVRFHNDIRPDLRRKKQTYIYAVLHSQQMAAIFGRERRTGAMVSKSADGEILVPSLLIRGIKPYRGSSNKGGIKAFEQMVLHSSKGLPTYLAVDGPKGPRGFVKRGVADLAKASGSSVLVLMAIPSKRWILHKAWDRFQIPKPFSTIDITFAEPLEFKSDESVQQFRERINLVLFEQEKKYDPEEVVFSKTSIQD